ncbi:site-specific integrase [Reichenbachiella ulvae]|uniref:Site-specific integrase n=1 Tax=Reichenbachiella ulvae TaxID=2980104 RepID=A0ABT3CSJ7_9BACT|nr:site-specific integrase [Reichenbachiella ulvae]MCV9386624.1 site-specific integrase [Reichenbachiella ulvae]
MPSITVILRNNKSNSKGECTIYIKYRHKETVTNISTGIRVLPNHWNESKQKVNSISGIRKSKRNEEALKEREKSDLYANSCIEKIKMEISSISRRLQHDGIDPIAPVVKEEFTRKTTAPKEKKETDLIKLFDSFIQNSNKSDSTKKKYGTAKYHLETFAKHKKKKLTVKSIDFKFYEEFTHYLYNTFKKPDNTKGLADNTVVSSIKNFKVFLTYLQNFGYDFSHIIPHLKISYQDTTIYYLTEEEIQKLYNHQFKKKKLEKIRDVFVLNCYLGLRYSDLKRLNKGHIVDGAIIMRAYKTLKDIHVTITPTVKEILEKYEYELPLLSEQKMNEHIKTACKEAGIDQPVERISTSSGNKTYNQVPKYEVITNHVAIKTFISLCSKKNIHPKTVSFMTGKTVKVIMKHYLGMDEKSVDDQMKKAFG